LLDALLHRLSRFRVEAGQVFLHLGDLLFKIGLLLFQRFIGRDDLVGRARLLLFPESGVGGLEGGRLGIRLDPGEPAADGPARAEGGRALKAAIAV